MTQEYKQLLLKDLCARLPYGVIVQVKDWATLDTELRTGHIQLLQDNEIELKPYLRPMSSMTEEEKEEYHKLSDSYYDIYFDSINSIDWLNAHHFDYRGLIEKNLALDCTGLYIYD